MRCRNSRGRPPGVRLQRLDNGDRLSEVVLVPPAAEEEAAAAEGLEPSAVVDSPASDA